MSDLISRQAAIDAINCDITITGRQNAELVAETIGTFVDRIKALPPAEPKRGRWISADAIFGGVPFYCSECGENTRDTVMGKPRWKFCPMCGAKMEK